VVFYHSLLTGLNGAPLAVIEGGVTTFIRTDHIGRPVFGTNTAGTKVWTAAYLPFGGVRTTTGTPTNLRFPGQWFQSESGLHQNWMRDYDPTTGRYLQADPLGLIDGASIYGYARQNPGRWIDPTGERVDPTADSYDPRGGSRAKNADTACPDEYAENKKCKVLRSLRGAAKIIWVACAIMFGADDNPNTDLGDAPGPRTKRPPRDDEYTSEPFDPPKPPPPP
jgi:RHS repeat-associated protein